MFFTVVNQDYVTEASNEYVIVGNSALVKSEIPSFVSDLVSVVNWVENEANTYMHSEKNYGTLN